jgi:hypothetical protein
MPISPRIRQSVRVDFAPPSLSSFRRFKSDNGPRNSPFIHPSPLYQDLNPSTRLGPTGWNLIPFFE